MKKRFGIWLLCMLLFWNQTGISTVLAQETELQQTEITAEQTENLTAETELPETESPAAVLESETAEATETEVKETEALTESVEENGSVEGTSEPETKQTESGSEQQDSSEEEITETETKGTEAQEGNVSDETESEENKESEETEETEETESESETETEALQKAWLQEITFIDRKDSSEAETKIFHMEPLFTPEFTEYVVDVPDTAEGLYVYGTAFEGTEGEEKTELSYVSVKDPEKTEACELSEKKEEALLLTDCIKQGLSGTEITVKDKRGEETYHFRIRRVPTVRLIRAVCGEKSWELLESEEAAGRSYVLKLPEEMKDQELELYPEIFQAEGETIKCRLRYEEEVLDQGDAIKVSYDGTEKEIQFSVESDEGKTVSCRVLLQPEESEKKPLIQEIGICKTNTGRGGELPMTREADLDKTLGGIVYSVEYSNIANSKSFYLKAIPTEGKEVSMELSASDLSGNYHDRPVIPSTTEKNYYATVDGNIFSSGAEGAKRAVYTLTVRDGEEEEVYKILIKRKLQLKTLTVTKDGNSLLNEKFRRDHYEYTADVQEGVDSLVLNCGLYDGQVLLTVNGETIEPSQDVELPLEEGTSVFQILLVQEENYADPSYQGMTYESEGSYAITLVRKQNTGVVFRLLPEDANLSLYDATGKRVNEATEGSRTFENLSAGDVYTYTITKYGYQGVKESFTAGSCAEISVELKVADKKYEELDNNEWWNYRNNEENNGITAVSTPIKASATTEKWAVKIGNSWDEACTPPVILGGAIYVGCNKYIYKISKETGEILAVSDEMVGSMVFALNPLTYAEGMIFAQVGDGQIQAFNARTLKSLWISEKLGGQTLSPITYKNGYIYTGSWNSEEKAGDYFCMSVTDEDPDNPKEIKYCTWKYSHRGGYYWAGAYATDRYVVFGSDDGSKEANYTNTSILYSVNSLTGEKISSIEHLKGDIRTSVVYDNGYIYFATKGGMLYRVVMNEDGTFGEIVSYDLGGMATASPVIYKGRVYVGVCGTGGQFNADGGHHFAVLKDTAAGLQLAYTVPIKGYPQAAALLSTAYEQEDYDGDGKPDGRVYLYFTYNAYPGGIYYLSDEPGQTEAKAGLLFEPDKEKQEYCISTICTDKEGNLYYKNDSGYLMAVSENSAYLDGMTATADKGKVKWTPVFSGGKSSYSLMVAEGVKKVVFQLDIPEGRFVEANGTACTGEYTFLLLCLFNLRIHL